MSPLEGLLYGFSVCLSMKNLLAVIGGSIIGTLVGVLPGIGPVGAIALLLPITMGMSSDTSLIMLAGIYYGSMYGGSTTSILVNVPGEATSVVTCLDGYQMAKKGRAGAALAVSAVGSFVAGTMGVVLLMFFAPLLAEYALSFGPPEYFAIALLGLFALSRITGAPFWQSVLVLGFGLAIATVGLDAISFVQRYTFGVVQLTQGIELVPVVMGLFGVAEVLTIAAEAGGLPEIVKMKFRELFPTRKEWRRSWGPMFRGSCLGFFWGLIPGPSTVLSTFASYKLEKSLSKHPEEFGTGAIEAVAGPESANNAAAAGAMVPMLSLGIPFTPGAAMLLAALLIQGVPTGPLLISARPEIFWGVVASMYIGNVALLILNFPLVGVWTSILKIPQAILIALILLLTLVGAYAINNSMLDLVVLIVMGILGYLFRKIKFDVAPIVVALVLGPMLETTMRESLYISRGDPTIFFTRPISGTILAILAIMLVAPPLWALMRKWGKRGTA
ncbi:MAG: tripartite tricarboxylate transporter permease [Proteobacteria bacterium]|nr:tripartite tricarboxylate transporter permease [Pseudomonadota bacterium]MBU2228474.1 tripartite tricarboxylate transporter permease [Pseudomonadota bacterium]MBU2261393.1 tripartite tricarboxylate transporter permease [Pseudomonadota bacterium]